MSHYTPIDCGFYDRLEHHAVRRDRCNITLRAPEDSVIGRIEDLFSRDQVEYMRLDDGREIRLDRIAVLNGFARPGAACDM